MLECSVYALQVESVNILSGSLISKDTPIESLYKMWGVR